MVHFQTLVLYLNKHTAAIYFANRKLSYTNYSIEADLSKVSAYYANTARLYSLRECTKQIALVTRSRNIRRLKTPWHNSFSLYQRGVQRETAQTDADGNANVTRVQAHVFTQGSRVRETS